MGSFARDTTSGDAPAEAASETGGAQVIDLAELRSRSIKGAAKPGPAKTKGSDAQKAEEKPEKARGAPKKKRASG